MENTMEIVTTAAETVAETVAETTAADMFGNITVEPMNFVNNLGYMATGMVGIFVVIGIIILATTAMNKFFSKNK